MGLKSKERAKTTGFQGVQPLVASSSKGQAQQQRIISQTLRISPALLMRITKHIRPLGPSATPDQQEKALRKLFDIIKIGGTLGITYQHSGGRKPRSPDEVIRAGKADCDELATLFVAAARHLNIKVTGIRLGAMEFSTSRPGTGTPEKHVALFVQGAKSKFIFDFTYGRTFQVADFKHATVQKAYAGFRISNGAHAGFVIRSISSMKVMGTVADIAAFHLLSMAQYNESMIAGTKSARRRAALMNATKSLLESAARLGSKNGFINTRTFNGFHSLGDHAFRQKDYEAAASYYTAAVGMIKNLPGGRQKWGNTEYSIRENLGISYEKKGKSTQALAQYNQMIKMDKREAAGYLRKIRLLVRRGNASLKRARGSARKRFLEEARGFFTQALLAAREASKNVSVTSGHQGTFQGMQTKIAAFMKRKRWALPR